MTVNEDMADDIPGEEAPPRAWIEVSGAEGHVWAKVHVDGGKTNSTRHVSSRREVEDIAAHYGIERRHITYDEGTELD